MWYTALLAASARNNRVSRAQISRRNTSFQTKWPSFVPSAYTLNTRGLKCQLDKVKTSQRTQDITRTMFIINCLIKHSEFVNDVLHMYMIKSKEMLKCN